MKPSAPIAVIMFPAKAWFPLTGFEFAPAIVLVRITAEVQSSRLLQGGLGSVWPSKSTLTITMSGRNPSPVMVRPAVPLPT